MQRPSPSAADWAYLAGIVDGEGCISAVSIRSLRFPRLTITQADVQFLTDLYEVFKVGRLNLKRVQGLPNCLLVWNIRKNNDLRWILKGVIPYLRLKKLQAKIALKLCDRSLSYEEQIKYDLALRKLKGRGYVKA